MTKYYFLGGQRVFLKEGGVPRYIHADHLGSTAIETNLSGQVSAERRYYAFGGERASSGTLRTENQFTSQKLDGTGLYYYGARYYDPEIGQFVSPDTIVPAPGEVFAYNRYMYGYGNPLRFSDPTGYYTSDEIKGHFGCNYWNCVEEQFYYGAPYEGLGEWLGVLLTAEDGYIIAAHHPTVEVSFGGVFLRNTNTGKIEIMGGSGPVSNLAVASFIDPMGSNGVLQLGEYDLRDQSGQSVAISSEG